MILLDSWYLPTYFTISNKAGMKIDQDIYTRLRSRDETGLSLLYDNYSESLYGIALRVLRNEAFAEDSIQKSFLKIWNNIDQYDESRSTFFTWMAQIVKNTAIDIRRLKSFQKEEKSESFDIAVHKTENTTIETDAMDVAKMVEGLDEKYAFVLEYLYLRGYSQRELADEFDMPIGTIKTRVKKGIQILRDRFSKEEKFFLGLLFALLLTLFCVL